MKFLSILVSSAVALALRRAETGSAVGNSVLGMDFDVIPDKTKAEGVDAVFDTKKAMKDYSKAEKEAQKEQAKNAKNAEKEKNSEETENSKSNLKKFVDDNTGTFKISGVSQWALYSQDVITEDDNTPGWSSTKRVNCYPAGLSMVGPFGVGEVTRSYQNLPPHSELRVKANFFFVDGWLGESGYMKASVGPKGTPAIVWNAQHAQDKAPNGFDMCGRVEVPESRFMETIELVLPHNGDELQLSWGSTMDVDNPGGAFWGVNGVELYIH